MLEMAHSVPMAGHLGKQKTAQRILQWFYWPTLFHDVAEFCKSCGSYEQDCQEPRWPVLEEPFSVQIAIDIVGPLPHSHSGKCYISQLATTAITKSSHLRIEEIEVWTGETGVRAGGARATQESKGFALIQTLWT